MANVLNRILSAAMALGILACSSEQTTTGPSVRPSLAQAAGTHAAADPTLAVNPSKNLDPDGRTVAVKGKGFPANVTVQLSECTGFPLICLVLMDVNTDKHGKFVSRVLVAFNFSVIFPFPPVPTCSQPTFTGDECLLFAVTIGASAFTPLNFSQ